MIPLQLGKYKIKKWLGGGRFGDVYLAEDTLLNKDFAIKVARVGHADIDAILDEARALSELNHPHIVRFFTVDMVENRFVIVTEYVEGKTLRAVLQKEKYFSKDKALFYAHQLLDALSFAHSKGIIHRDVKPENIIVADTEIKLLDFGLAKVFKTDPSMTMGGTPAYMAPETWKGIFTEKSDQWSAAVVILEMLTGKNPFLSENLDELRRKITTGIDVSEVLEDEELAEILSKALDPDPENRYTSCKAFLKALKGKTVKIKPMNFYTKKSQSILDILTDEQREAIESDHKRILVIGGPGTGKTFSLIAKAVQLLENGVLPSEIVITTFNIRGLREIEGRLQKYLPESYQDIWLGNFHQLALRILLRFGYLLGLPSELEIIPPSQRGTVAKRLAEKVSRKVSVAENAIKELVLKRFYKARLELMDKESFISSSRGRWGEILSEFWDLYQDYIFKEKRIDYDDLIYFTAILFKEFPEVADFYKERLNYFLIDEIQDLNKAQILILEKLNEEGFCFFTGDDDQSIYQWRGAHPEYIRTLKDKGFKIYKLTQSFRLHKDLRDAAYNLIQRNINRMPKIFWTSKEGDKFYMDVRALKTPAEEADFVCDIIEILRLKEGYSYSDFCILYRTNNRGRLIEQYLKKRKIPYSYQFGKTFYQREEIKLAMEVLKYADRGSKIALNKVLNLLHAVGLKKTEIDENHPFSAFLNSIKGKKSPSQVLAGLMKFFGKTQNNISIAEASITRLTSIEELYKQALDFEERSKTGTISAFLNHLKFLVDSGLAEEDEGVRLLSVHAAKGLEFPVVFLVGMVEGEFPLARALGIPEELEEERRLCYTAITRATDKLFITYYRYSSRYSRFEEKPSRFIKEMLAI